MRLWNDYEGTTIADVYPIEKLLRPEGRSAFFSTSNGTGTPAVIRLIESINDESEILNRWKTVADLKEAHLITLKKFGQTIFEGTPLIYVLMESTEADLAGILQDRPLNLEETRQIAVSLTEALQALHASDIVHEHVDPTNVMATTDEVVKLRSDCVREAPEGEEGAALKQKDVFDLATVLLQSLTLRKNLSEVDAHKLPAPFNQIIPNGISGAWGLSQISAALKPLAAKPSPMPPVRPTPPAASTASGKLVAQQIPLAIPRAPENTSWGGKAVEAPKTTTQTEPLRTEPVIRDRVSQPIGAAPLQHRQAVLLPLGEDKETHRRRLWMAIAPGVVVIAAALSWYVFHTPAHTNEATQPITTLSSVNQPAASQPDQAAPATPSVAVPSPALVQPSAAVGDADHRWRVVAFTYNRSDQAQHKADQLKQKDGSLQPEVFSPSGRAPYLVTVGGAMTHDEAAAFRRKAQQEGLPRDSYIQNYDGHAPRHARRRR